MSQYGKVFMSYRKKAIRWDRLDDGTIFYMVAKGDRTDEFFSDWNDAMEYIDKIKDKKERK